MGTLRFHLLLGAASIAAAGCAQQPVRADHTAAAAMSPTSPTVASAPAAASVQWASVFPPRLLVFAYEQGWRQVVMIGDKGYFCRADAPSGSLIPQHRCVTPSQLEFIRLTVQQQRQQLAKPIVGNRMG